MAKYSNSFSGQSFPVYAYGAAVGLSASAVGIRGGSASFMAKISEIYMGGEAASSSTVASMAFGRVSSVNAGADSTTAAGVLTDIMSSAQPTNVAPLTVTVWTTSGPIMAATGVLLRLPFNAYGGIVRWVSSPDQNITMTGNAVFGTGTQGVGGYMLLQNVSVTNAATAQISGHVLLEMM
jgi:hypothetical protein